LNKIECEIIGLSQGSTGSASGAYALLLKEVYGNRRLPILIGQFEAQAIALELESIHPPRPLTHDLLKLIIENLGGTVQEVIITELRDNTFFAKIILEVSSLTNEIDSRPSDAIALAIRANAPIYVSDTVMEIASVLPFQEGQEFPTEQEEEEKIDLKDASSFSREAKVAALQEKLRQSLEVEDYERAAKIRDEIKRLSSEN
jgi:hypothetical protein